MAVYYFTICILTGLGFFLTEKQKHAKTTVLYLSVVFVLFWLPFVMLSVLTISLTETFLK